MFPGDYAVFKILYLALKNISKKWTIPIHNWNGAMNQFAIHFENQLPSGSLLTARLDRISKALQKNFTRWR